MKYVILYPGKLTDRWARANDEYERSVLMGDAFWECAWGWLVASLLVPVAFVLTVPLQRIGFLSGRAGIVCTGFGGVLALTGFAWSYLQHLLQRRRLRLRILALPSPLDDAMVTAIAAALSWAISSHLS